MGKKTTKKTLRYGNLFGNNPDISITERFRVTTEIEKIGGLTFTVTVNKEGWMAQCNEVGGIITGNTNPNPSPVEIESQIRDAIYAAFNVKSDKLQVKRSVLSPLQKADMFEYKFDSQGNGK